MYICCRLDFLVSVGGQSKKVSQAVHDVVVSQLDDNDVQSSEKYSGNTKMDPLSRLFPGAPFMCISNEDLNKGRGNASEDGFAPLSVLRT